MKYRLVVIDLDGTLVNEEGKIADEDKAAVQRLTRNFINVSLCTGRILATTLPFIKELNLGMPHIMFDGALIYAPSSHSTVFSMPIERAVVKEAVAYCRANNVYLELYSRDVFFAEKDNWSDDIHRNFFGVSPTFVNFDDIVDKEKILKAELVVHSPEEAAEAKKFADCFTGKLSYSVAYTPAFPEVEFLNLVDPRVSKGAALKHLASELGAYYTEIIAIGDGLNDISLLKEAGNAVAMGNAPDEVKQVCQYTTLDVDHHGVAEAIKYFFPEP